MEFEIHHGDSLTNDWELLNEMNPAKKLQCDAVVANPPFSYRYVSTAEAEPDIDLAAVHAQLSEIEKRIGEASEKHNRYLKELGLPPV